MFSEVFGSHTFAIPGYPGYYYRPADGAVISNRTNEKYRIGKSLTIYQNTNGDKYVNVLDYQNCRRKLMISKIIELINEEAKRAQALYSMGAPNNTSIPQITQPVKQNYSYTYKMPVSRSIKIDQFGNVILPPAIEFYKE